MENTQSPLDSNDLFGVNRFARQALGVAQALRKAHDSLKGRDFPGQSPCLCAWCEDANEIIEKVMPNG